MATAIRVGINPSQPLESVVETDGVTTVSNLVEITFDQTTTSIVDGSVAGGARAQKISEILIAIDILKQYIERMANTAQS